MTSGSHERGQVIVEFAFAASLFLLLFMGIVEFGRALFQYDLVGQAARVGTRYASVNTPAASDCGTLTYAQGGTCQTQIVNYLTGKTGLDTTNLTPTITFGGSNPSTCSMAPVVGCTVAIKLQYAFTFILPFPATTLTTTSQSVITAQ